MGLRPHRALGADAGQYLAVSLSAADDFVDTPAAQLRERFLPAMEDIFPAARDARITDFFVTRERRATFRQEPGCGEQRPGAATRLAGLVLAGAWTDTGWPDTMEGAVRSGLIAARELRREMTQSRRRGVRGHAGDRVAGADGMTAVIPAGVETARDLVGPALAAAVEPAQPGVRTSPPITWAWTAAGGGQGAAARAGPAVRPAGRGAPERGVPAAVAVELVHNFSLLHDDIMDGDTERRHRPTAWTVHGVGAAILAGDALLALAQDILLEDTAAQGIWAARCLSAAVQRLIAGQGADLAFEQRDDVTLTECLTMAGDKTAALMACACSIGAIHVGAPPELAMGLAGFGAHAGLAFQLTDDLLGIWGAPEVTGKPVRADLRARKKSLPVVAALSAGHAPRSELAALLARTEPLSEDDLLLAAGLVEEAGGKTWTENEAATQLAAADKCLADTDMPDDVRAEFAGIAEFITARQW